MWPGRREEKRRIRRALLAALASLAAGIALGQPAPGSGAPESAARLEWPTDLGGAGLVVRGAGTAPAEAGAWQAAPTVATAVSITVTGIVARARVDQTFDNPSDELVEAVYVFPLPEGAAIDRLELEAGGRRIVGQVRERREARRTYETAKQEGRRASLLEQARPDLFTVAVAGIAPHDRVTVHLEYQELVRYDLGIFRLRFPLVAAPRYTPPADRATSAVLDSMTAPPPAGGPAVALDPPAPAAPVVVPGSLSAATALRPVRLTVDLRAGIPLASVESPTHALRVRRPEKGLWRAELADAEVPADRDFELVWRPRRESAPTLARFEEDVDGERYAALLFLPPAPDVPEAPIPRDLVIVLDTSGSMGGASIEQAKRAVRAALSRLGPADRFDVIRFADDAEALFPASVAADPRSLGEAYAWVDGLQADGGTNMRPALRLALDDPPDPTVVRQVLFVTDGCVGNEEELFSFLEQHLGRSRLFTVGIGSAPNSWFMTRAAELGRGTHTFIGSVGEVEDKMAGLFAKLERPVLADLDVAWDDPSAESYPQLPPDLYVGEPLLLVARLERPDAGVEVSGRRADTPFDQTLAPATPRPASGLDKLWARRKIDALEAAMRAPGADGDALRGQIVDLALAHGLTSRYTSFVAVEERPSVAPGTPQDTRAVPNLLPAGWSDPNGEALPQGGTRAPLELAAALLLALAGFLLRRFGAAS
jgi:Ca-activated chloride channel family protein